jgi:hypothetical protein
MDLDKEEKEKAKDIDRG